MVSTQKPLSERFWQLAPRGAAPDVCWEWRGHVDPQGYGRIRNNGRLLKAHRVSYEINSGPIPSGLLVCHRCDNRRCINPGHLFLGTVGDNNRDAIAKGRAAHLAPCHGEKNSRAKLTEDDVLVIRGASVPVSELAQRYAVSQSNIRGVIARKLWKHVP